VVSGTETVRSGGNFLATESFRRKKGGDDVRTILVLGREGQVGWELSRSLGVLGDVAAVDVDEVDLTDADAVRHLVRSRRPEVVVNAAAYTAVDRAESDPERSRAVNAVAPGILAEEAARLESLMIHYSTDYVFDGASNAPYTETDPTRPINEYGRGKLLGEKPVAAPGGAWVVLRTSWVYGMRGANFLRTMLRLAADHDELRIVDDQVGAPTWCRCLADATTAIVAACLADGGHAGRGLGQRCGVYHAACGGETSWRGFAEAIFRRAPEGAPRPRVVPIATEDYPTPAKRPRNSRLSCDRLDRVFGIRLPNWERALDLCLDVARPAVR